MSLSRKKQSWNCVLVYLVAQWLKVFILFYKLMQNLPFSFSQLQTMQIVYLLKWQAVHPVQSNHNAKKVITLKSNWDVQITLDHMMLLTFVEDDVEVWPKCKISKYINFLKARTISFLFVCHKSCQIMGFYIQRLNKNNVNEDHYYDSPV